MKYIHIFFTLSFLCFACMPSYAKPPKPPKGYRWVLQEAFSDEFNGNKLDSEKWLDYFPGWKGRSPAKFVPKAVSVKDGFMQIENGVLDKQDGKFTMYGGAVVSKSKEAHYGYYECSFKASKIEMSTTFWMSNGKVLYKPSDCPNDRYSQELDIQECVGGSEHMKKFRHGMNSNTHYRYVKCGERKETFISKGAGTLLDSEVSEEFHTYGAWWKNAEEVDFYADNQFFEKVKVTKDISSKPFDRPMQVNMVTETYDWQPAPSNEHLEDKSINTSFYDWVRGYKLVPVNEKYSHIATEVDLYQNYVMVENVTPTVFGQKEISLDYTFSNNQDCKIEFKIVEKKNKKFLRVVQKDIVQALQGYGFGETTLKLKFTPEKGKTYQLLAQLVSKKDNTSLKKVSIDLSE